LGVLVNDVVSNGARGYYGYGGGRYGYGYGIRNGGYYKEKENGLMARIKRILGLRK